MIHGSAAKSYQLPDELKNRLLDSIGDRGEDERSIAWTPDNVDLPDFFPLRAAISNANRLGLLMGEQPPRPPTRRAQVSALLIRLMRRALFWYTPQIVRMHVATIAALEEQMNISMQVVRILQQTLSMASSNESFVVANNKEIAKLVCRIEAVIHEQKDRSAAIVQAARRVDTAMSRLDELESEIRELTNTVRGRSRGSVG